ncbi:glycosyltransferase family 39 protein [Xanthobacter sp.]|uniref:ArnT family glycosyltransferase n=1 Tax=Xanthobacter sp. TaxID=35809 RepID=UPI0025D39E3B|nr:glycosyltransferase family 39 protein [Xanthobacter sp.]
MAISEPASDKWRVFDLDLPLRLVRLLDVASARHGRAVVLLVAVALLAFLPGFFNLSPIDRDEARFAQATKQMLESGNYIDIRFHTQARHKKPVGIYWLQAATVKAGEAVIGPSALTSIWLYRLPSLFAAIGAVLLTYWTALVFLSRRGTLFAALMMAGCVLLGVEARLAKTDAVLLFTILAAFGALARAYVQPPEARKGDLSLAFIFWTALAAGVLVKGPVAPLFVGPTIVALAVADRSGGFLRPLKPLIGLAWCLLLVLPWFVAIYIVTNGAFYQHAVGVDMMGKVAEGAEGHWGPPGTYFLAAWGTFWPSIIIAAMAAPYVWRNRREAAVRFLLCWLVPSWVIFEIAVTKLPHYVLPVYPALAILAALAVERGGLAAAGSRLAGVVWFWPAFGIVVSLALGAAYLYFGSGFGLAAWPLLIIAIVILWWAARSFSRVGIEGAFLTALAGALVLYLAAWQTMLPQMRALWISERLAAVVKQQGCQASKVASFPYQEPSLVFLVGTQINYGLPNEAAALLKKGGCALAFIDDRFIPAFERHAGLLALKYHAVATISGFTYNGGRLTAITVFRSDEAAP